MGFAKCRHAPKARIELISNDKQYALARSFSGPTRSASMGGALSLMGHTVRQAWASSMQALSPHRDPRSLRMPLGHPFKRYHICHFKIDTAFRI